MGGMSDTTTEPNNNGNEAGSNGEGQQPPAPTTPTNSTPPAEQTPPGANPGTGGEAATQEVGAGSKGEPEGKSFTQADLDRIINDRLDKQQKQFAKALGLDDGEETDPTKLLEQQQASTKAERTRADTAEAKALALAQGIKPERVDRFVKLVDVGGALDGVDGATERSEALKAAVAATVEDVPEFKGTAVPASSGGDRAAGGDNGKPVYTRAQIQNMSRDELVEKSDELQQAMAEGRIKQ